MLSTPHKRFLWARSDRHADLTFFRALLSRRRRPLSLAKDSGGSSSKYQKDSRWKPATWTPWLWMK